MKDLLKPKEGQTESETPQESTEITETSDIPTDFEIKFDDPFDVMNELPDLPGLSDSLPQSTRFLGRNAQQRLMEQDPEEHITDRVQENQQQQGQPESESNMENSPSEVGNLEGSAQESTINPTGETPVAETPLVETAGEDALNTGLDLGGELLADIDPLTAVFGLILGIGSLVGGMEGANSIKNPPIPKMPPMAQSSVQFGF